MDTHLDPDRDGVCVGCRSFLDILEGSFSVSALFKTSAVISDDSLVSYLYTKLLSRKESAMILLQF